MDDPDRNMDEKESSARDNRLENEPVVQQGHVDPFHAQLDGLQNQPPIHQQQLSQPQIRQNFSNNGLGAFNMAGLAPMLPQLNRPEMIPVPQHVHNAPGVFPFQHVQQMQPPMPYVQHPGPPLHSNMTQQQPYLVAPYEFGYVQPYLAPMPPYMAVPSTNQYLPGAQVVQQQSNPPVDSRTVSQTPVLVRGSRVGDASRTNPYDPNPSCASPFPRGPPRKPKQSGHALWVGNLPPSTNISDLKDHFSRDATKDIESLFLISRSNCAFANYRTEATCLAAINRFHDSRFQGVRLSCRLRKTTLHNRDKSENDPSLPTATSSHGQDDEKPKSTPSSATETQQQLDTRVAEKYFIIKSLTQQDLDQSVKNGTWATQPHNEASLARAFEQAQNVYLIFSANKSGEYFGYARMTSSISGEQVNLGTTVGNQDIENDDTASQSIPTPATATAPRGRIFDDSARGTIFWEAILSDDEEETNITKEERKDGSIGRESSNESKQPQQQQQQLARQFSVQWLSTARLPFYRTRGLRNPWNSNREVKVARDGTELEPSVGRKVVQMFQRVPPSIPDGYVMPGPSLAPQW